MKASAAILLGLTAFVNGNAYFTNSVIDPVPGEPFTLTWTDATGPVDIILKDGPQGNLQTVDTLTTSATGDEFTFTLDPADYPAGTYAFEIVDAGVSNWSKQFSFAGTASDEDLTTTDSASPSTTSTDDDSETTSTASPTTSAEEEEETSSSTTTTTSRSSSATDEADQTDGADGADQTGVPGAAGRVSSPLALILVAIAAMLYLN